MTTRNCALLLALLGSTSCTSSLFNVSVTGNLQVQGDMPADFSFELYSATANSDAFDTSYCEETSSECYGRVAVNKLDSATTIESVTIDGDQFTLDGVAADLAYILVVTDNDDAVDCSTDVVGFDEETKVINAESAIAIEADGSLDVFELPRDVRLSCAAPATEPDPPADTEPPPDQDEDIAGPDDPADLGWTAFTITDKTGGTVYADASAGDTVATGIDCANPPSSITLHGTTANTDLSEAYVRIQFGEGEEATYYDATAGVYGGELEQAQTLTGGHAIVQLDTDDIADNGGESYTITFCEEEPPAQELLVIVSWDKDDTDVDIHVTADDGTEVAYYNMSTPWGDLDIDDVDGYGPETVTSKPDAEGYIYSVNLHYYSDHGNGPTDVTTRVVYLDPDSGEVCDIATTDTLSSYDWVHVGDFGPGLVCPN